MGSTTSLSPRMTQSILLSKPSSSQRFPYRDNHELKFFTKTISSSESFPSGPICSLGKYFAVDIDYQILEPLQYPLRGDNLPKRIRHGAHYQQALIQLVPKVGLVSTKGRPNLPSQSCQCAAQLLLSLSLAGGKLGGTNHRDARISSSPYEGQHGAISTLFTLRRDRCCLHCTQSNPVRSEPSSVAEM